MKPPTEKHSLKIHFLGGAKTVTGSKFLLETPEVHVLIDCGMFQGFKELRERNWADLPVDVSAIDIVLVSHGHLDHTGYLPRLVQQGFKGTIMGTAPTLAIARIILEDSARIHEEDAKRAHEEQYTKHHPAKPFYNQKEAAATLRFFKPIQERIWITLSQHIKCRFQPVGHIIGATFIELEMYGKRFVFSGDIGRPNDYLLDPPDKPVRADYLFLESTYGDRLHEEEAPEHKIIALVNKIIESRGTLIIPSFAVERLQTLMYILWKLYQRNRIPNVPVYADSPMGNNVLAIFEQFPKWHKLSLEDYHAMCDHINIVTSYRETWEVIDRQGPKIVIAGSGMVTGGRVLTYLKQMIDMESTQILLVGYQAEGTRGRHLQEGVHEVKLYGKYFPVKAQVHQLRSLSAHADQRELLNWLDHLETAPQMTYLVHGEAAAADALRVKLQTEKKWRIHIPELNEVVRIEV
jgi:metallo-beta-lactamase family protein